MPAFAKTPRFIISTIIILWLAYVVWANSSPAPIQIYVFPFIGYLELRLAPVLIVTAVFGAAVALLVHWLWTRRSSKNGSASVAA
jgi:hypothetical protein